MENESNSGSEKLTRILCFRVTTNEYQKVKKIVYETNTSVSDYLRKRFHIERGKL